MEHIYHDELLHNIYEFAGLYQWTSSTGKEEFARAFIANHFGSGPVHPLVLGVITRKINAMIPERLFEASIPLI